MFFKQPQDLLSFKQFQECEFLHVSSNSFPEIKIPERVSKEYGLSTPDENDLYMFFLDKMLERVSDCLNGKTLFLITDYEKGSNEKMVLKILCPVLCTKKELELIYENVNKALEKICNEIEQKEQTKKRLKVRF